MTTAKLFKNGRSQAVRLPKEFRMPGKVVYVRKIGKSVLLTPEVASWDSFFEACRELSHLGFKVKRDRRPPQSRPDIWP